MIHHLFDASDKAAKENCPLVCYRMPYYQRVNFHIPFKLFKAWTVWRLGVYFTCIDILDSATCPFLCLKTIKLSWAVRRQVICFSAFRRMHLPMRQACLVKTAGTLFQRNDTLLRREVLNRCNFHENQFIKLVAYAAETLFAFTGDHLPNRGSPLIISGSQSEILLDLWWKYR